MQLHQWKAIPLEQLSAALARRAIHTDRITIARLELKQGAVVPDHHHENEQVTILMAGKLQFITADQDLTIEAGEVMQIPSNVVHRVIALEDSWVFDLFAPVRADWLRGDDAYLRRG
ncbi:MAG: cupin domain-containing protein [Acidobacteria bacterium]|nr:cupin domain-containing protein [Acidobacteriota bacterium]